MSRIAFLADSSHPVRRRAQRGPREFFSSLLPSARHVHNGAGDVRGLRGQQPEDRCRDLLRLSTSLHRDERLDTVDTVRLAALGVESGVDESGADAIYPNAFLGNLPGEPNRERVDGSLAGSIVDVLAGRSVNRGAR